MQTDYDYHFCVRSSLQVMKEKRKMMYSDNIDYNTTIYTGLHESFSKQKRDLYFQLYLVEWLDSHWDYMIDILKNHNEYSQNQRKQMVLFFADYFSKMINECECNGLLSKLSIPELLKVEKHALNDMLLMTEKWEVNSDRLIIEMKKHREQFKLEIEKLENQKGSKKWQF